MKHPMKEIWPEPPGSACERLDYVLKAYENFLDSEWMVKATIGMYEPNMPEGLRLGDLRHLAKLLRQSGD